MLKKKIIEHKTQEELRETEITAIQLAKLVAYNVFFLVGCMLYS